MPRNGLGLNEVWNNNIFRENAANYGGGAYIYAENIFINENRFIENEVVAASSGSSTMGGGIFLKGNTVTLTKNTFTSNSATAYDMGASTLPSDSYASGGGVYFSGESISLFSTLFPGFLSQKTRKYLGTRTQNPKPKTQNCGYAALAPYTIC